MSEENVSPVKVERLDGASDRSLKEQYRCAFAFVARYFLKCLSAFEMRIPLSTETMNDGTIISQGVANW